MAPIAYLVSAESTYGKTSHQVLKEMYPDLATALAAMLNYAQTWCSVSLTPCPGWHQQPRRPLAAGMHRPV